MSKISIYEVAPVPKLADKLIGTSVGGVIEDITYNFTLQELLTLFIPNIPQNTLQGVLDYGNTATQNINLTGTINTTNINVGATANILNSYLTGQTHITGGLYDRLNSIGTAGQFLRSTGTQVEWYTLPTVIPTLQQVLTSGNTADVDIILDADIEALNININTASVFNQLILDGSLRDYNGYIGAAGMVLTSTGSAVAWVNLPVYTATSPLSIDSITRVISIQKAGSTQDGYLSSLDWITFDGKQNAISLTTSGSSGAATFISNTLNIPNYTLAGLGGVPETRTLTINGVSYNLSADRTWTIAAGVSSVGATAPLSSTGGGNPVISISQANTSTDGYLSSIDWDTFNDKQDTITLTTTGTSGPSTLVGSTLNIPDYGSVLTGYVPYTGATGPVNLGPYNLTVNSVVIGRGTSTNVNNIAIGNNNTMGVFTATGASNIAIGNTTLPYLTSGYSNVAVGGSALIAVTTGYQNTALGASAGSGIQTGINNTFIGRFAGGDILTGSGNTIIGSWLGNNVTDNNVVLSDGYGNLRYRYDGTNNNFYQNVNFASTLGNGTYTYTLPSATGTIALVGDLSGYVPTSRLLTINGTQYDLSANRSWSVGTVTSVAELTLGTTGTDLSSSVATGTTTPVITLNVPTASSANRGALSSTDWSTFNNKVGGVSASSPLSSSGGSNPNITIQQASGSQDGYLSSTDWSTFNNKQAAGNYITSLTGEATATGPGASSVTLDNAAVTGKVLTGVNITGGSITSTDSILTAFGKVQNQINGLIGGSIYQGTWNANTNTPTLTSGVGVKGYYYIVAVAGTTNLDGITDWHIGDWAIFDGLAWQQVDNTDAVTSVNGFTGAVSLTTDNISEGSANLYFLDSRARAALSSTSGSGTYNSSTGVITIPTNTNELTNGANFITLGSLSGTTPISYNSSTGAISIGQSGTASDGYLSSTDWNTFNNKQNALTNPVTGTGTINYLPKFTGSSAIGDSIAYDGGSSIGINTNAPYDSTQFKLDVNGGLLVKNTSGTTAQFVLINANPASGGNAAFIINSVGGTSTTSWGQIQTYYGLSIPDGALRLQPSGGQVLVGTLTSSAFMVDINGSLRANGQLTLGSTISNGTYTYTLPSATGTLALTSDLSGYVPTSRTLTINGVTYDLSADRSWSITAGVSSVTATSPLFSSGGSTPNLTIQPASVIQDGYLSSTDWNTFNNKVGGSGTTNFLPKFTGSGTIGNSVAYDGGSSIGINTTSPYSSSVFKLDVNGGVIIKNTSGTTAQLILIDSDPSGGGNNGFIQMTAGGTSSTSYGALQTYYGTSIVGAALRLQPVGGSVLVNKTTDSGLAALQVTGAIQQSSVTAAIVKADSSGVFTAAVAGTDYLAPSALSGYVPTSRTLSINGTTYDLSADRSWTITAGISSVSGTAPISVSTISGAATVSISQATTSTDGYLSSSDWTTFNNKVPPSRTLTINGTTYDLSANRSWTISPNINSTTTQDYTATAGQTVFTVTGGYTVGQLAVFYNGSKLASNEFTATNGSTFTLATACQVNDIVQAVASVTGGGIGGSGATGQVAYWNGSGTQTGTNNFYWDNTNVQLGVGTNAPSAGITSYSTVPATQFKSAGTAPAMTFSNTLTSPTLAAVFGLATGSGQFITGTAAGDFAIANQSATAGAIVFGTGTTEKMRMTSAGTLSIGNTNTTYKLDVTGTGRFTDALTATQGNFFQTNASGFAINMKNRNANQQWSMVVDVNAVDDKFLGLYDATNGAYRTVFTNTGNVGIGTSSPTSIGSGYTTLDVRGTTGGGVAMGNATYAGYIYTDTSLNIQSGNIPITFLPNGTERMRITSAGNVGIGNTAPSNTRLTVTGSNTSSSNFSFVANNSVDNAFLVRNDGAISTGNLAASPYNLTVATTANLFVDSGGYLYRAISSRKYKKDIINYDRGINELMNLRPVFYKGISDYDGSKQYAGLIAEEVHDLGLTEFVVYAEDGTPDALAYSNMVALLVKAVQEQQIQIEELKAKIK